MYLIQLAQHRGTYECCLLLFSEAQSSRKLANPSHRIYVGCIGIPSLLMMGLVRRPGHEPGSKKLVELLKLGGFKLTKIISNTPHLLDEIESNDHLCQPKVIIVSDEEA